MIGHLLRLPLLVACLAGLAAPACAASDPARVLSSLQARVQAELEGHFAFVTFPHRVTTRLTADGDLTVTVEVTTQEFPAPQDAREFGAALSSGLVDYLGREYPRLRLSPDSRLRVKRPFSFTENLPSYTIELSAVRPPLPPAAHARRPPGPAELKAAAAREADVRRRLGKALSRRYVVRRLAVGASGERAFRVEASIWAATQGGAKDRARLANAIRTVDEALKVVGPFVAADGSAVSFDLHDEDESPVGRLAGLREDGRWRVPGGLARMQAADASLGAVAVVPAASTRTTTAAGPPPAGTRRERATPPENAATPVRRPLIDRIERPMPACEDSPQPLRPPSYENLVEVPSSIVAPKGTVRGRIDVLGRKAKGAAFSNVDEARTLIYGESVTFSTARNIEYTVGYQRLHQTTLFADTGREHGVGNAATFSAKLQAPPTIKRNAHFALGVDWALTSRADDAIRLPDDKISTDGLWAAFDVWTSPISVVHVMARRTGFFSGERELTKLALATEWFPHHPIRRAYAELVVDDRHGKLFSRFGKGLSGAVYANAGLEAALGRSASFRLAFPHVFSSQDREFTLSVMRYL